MGWRKNHENEIRGMAKTIFVLILAVSGLFAQRAGATQAASSKGLAPSAKADPNAKAKTLPSIPAASAKIQGILIQADSMYRDTETEMVELEGHVQVIFNNQHLKCDKAKINLRSKVIDAVGDVVAVTPSATMGGTRILMDYETETGLIYDGYVQSGNVIFEGTLIQKTGDKEYIADNANYTSCTTCPEAWSFSGKRIRAELGGYAYIKNSLLRIGSVPVFWLPYLVVPLKSNRQSGVVNPSFESTSNGGLAISQGYFWAISRSSDATFWFKNYELRGRKGIAEYRYVLAPQSGGALNAEFMRDRVFSGSSRYKLFQNPENQGGVVDRWFLRYGHYHILPDGYVHRTQLNNASDLQYPKDFPEETRLHGDSAMENRTSITKNTDDMHFSVDLDYYKSLLQADPLAGNADSVHRLPEIRISQKQIPIGQSDYRFSADLNYVNFARSEFAWDEITTQTTAAGPQRFISNKCNSPDWSNSPECYKDGNGKYDPGTDLIRTGQRVDFNTAVVRPIQLQNIDLSPKLSYRETQYFFPVGEDRSNTRRYLRAEISARTTFSRIFGDTSVAKSENIKHEVQPQVSLTTIPWLHHPSHAFFGSFQDSEGPFFSQQTVSDSDLNSPFGLQFDFKDRVYDRKVVTFAVMNKLTKKTWEDSLASYRQFLTWKVAQSYDAHAAEKSANNQPWSDLSSEISVSLDRFQVYQNANYYPYQQVTNTSTRVRLYDHLKKDFVELGHLLSYSISPGKSDADYSTRTEDLSVTLKKNIHWLDLVGKMIYDLNPATGKYVKSWGYGAQIMLPGECWYINLTQYQVTGGDQKSKLDFEFSWDGQPRKTLPESLLQKFGF